MVWPLSSAAAKCETPPEIRKISFSGSGWLFYYEMGVSQALRDIGAVRPGLFIPGEPEKPQTRVVGASGGSLAAACGALDIDSTVAREVAMTMWDRAAEDPSLKFHLDVLLDEGLDTLKDQIETAPHRWHAKNGGGGGKPDGSEANVKACTCGAAELNAKLAKEIERDTNTKDDVTTANSIVATTEEGGTAFPRTWEDVARGRLAVYMGTYLDPKKTNSYVAGVRSDFASFADGKETLINSCMAPGLTGERIMNSSPAQVELDRAGESSAGIKWNVFPPGFDTSKPTVEVDGGLPPNFQPEGEFSPNVINVTPVWFARYVPNWPADITPAFGDIPLRWLFFPPANRDKYDDVWIYGYVNGIEYAARNGFVTAERARELEAAAGGADPAMLSRKPNRAYQAFKTVLVIGAVAAGGRFLVKRSPYHRVVSFFKTPSRG